MYVMNKCHGKLNPKGLGKYVLKLIILNNETKRNEMDQNGVKWVI